MIKSLTETPTFVYVGDPMCSWCWGFAPVLEELQQRFTLDMRVIVGGLRPGPSAQALNPAMARFLTHHWEQVEARTGQPFNHNALTREGWMYDTELPAIAVVTMRTLNEKQTLPLFTRLQQAFYAEDIDVTDPAVYPRLLDGLDVDGDRFHELLGSPQMKELAWSDFSEARRLGVSGFPTLLLDDNGKWSVVSTGYAPIEALAPPLENWLVATYGGAGQELVCEVGEVC